jgi:hypothetical protein
LSRAQSVAWAVQFFAVAGWTAWAARVMLISARWAVGGEAAGRRWRRLGWSCVACGMLLSVSLRKTMPDAGS